eukprot:3658976-Rhodomonas_salina.1
MERQDATVRSCMRCVVLRLSGRMQRFGVAAAMHAPTAAPVYAHPMRCPVPPLRPAYPPQMKCNCDPNCPGVDDCL